MFDEPRSLLKSDDLKSFDCGRKSINAWLHRHGWSNHHLGSSRMIVIPVADSDRVAGYVTLSAAQIQRALLPRAQQRNQPDPVPAILMGQLAVDTQYQKQGLARKLIFRAFRTAFEASKTIGAFCILTHPIDAAVREFYQPFGFSTLEQDPQGVMAVRMKEVARAFEVVTH